MRTPIVSAIVPVYNGQRFLAEALDSALAQTLGDIELTVVDDGSTDSRGQIAADYAARHPGVVRLLRQSNHGLCHARNSALAAARGTYMALLDSDDVWLADHLADCVDVLQRRPALALAHADIERIDADGRLLRHAERHWHEAGDDAFATLFLRREHVCCPTAVFRRATIERVGGFDMQFNKLGCEDRDLWLRIAAGAEIAYLPRVHARYRIHAANMSANFAKMLSARIQLVDKVGKTARGLPLRRRALAAAHCNLGDELMDAERRPAAFAAYARAFAIRPIESNAVRGMLRTLLKPTGTANRP